MLQRSSILFLGGLFAAAGIAIGTESTAFRTFSPHKIFDKTLQKDVLQVQSPRALSPEDWKAAQTAWRYIAANTQPSTGWVDSVENFPSSTLWDQGSYIFALIAARRLELIPTTEFDLRVSKFLGSFEALELFEGALPNKVYDTRSLKMVNYENEETPRGIGWSALDIGRLLLAFRALEKQFPQYGIEVRSVLSGWAFSKMAYEGELWGTEVKEGETELRQEGRLGYEQYAARAAALWGLDSVQAASALRYLDWTQVYDIDVPLDTRRSTTYEAIAPITSEPFILQAIELGLNSESEILAASVYAAQEARHRQTDVPTMVSEDHLNVAPHFLYASVHSDGKQWAVVAENGQRFDELRTVSAKAVFGWDVIFQTDYTQFLRRHIQDIADKQRGWPAGIFEADGATNDVYTLNTNAIILEALHFKAFGPFWSVEE